MACLILVYACSSCGGDGGPVAPPDDGSPLIEIRFPTATAFDRDSDGLVDLEVGFSDSLSGVDVGSIRVASLRQVKGPAATGENLLAYWRVQRADSTGLVIEETVDNLLPRGAVSLEVGVRDRRGNEASRTLRLDLPPASRHKVIDLRALMQFNTSQVTVGPDGRKAYVTTEEPGRSALSIIDLSTLEWLKTVRSPIRALSEMVVDVGRNRLYVVSVDEPRVAVFDLASETFLSPMETTFRAIGAAMSVMRDRLYVGLELSDTESSAFLSVIDLALGEEERVIDLEIGNPLNPGDPLHMSQLLFGPGEEELFATTNPNLAPQGILVVDPDEGSLIDQLDLWPENPEELGGALDLDFDGSTAVATVYDRILAFPLSGSGAVRIGRVGPDNLIPIQLDIAPDGQDIAVGSGDGGAGYMAVQLMDAGTLRVIWEDRLPPTAIFPAGIAFRPDGNVFMVAGSGEDPYPSPAPHRLSVYIRR